MAIEMGFTYRRAGHGIAGKDRVVDVDGNTGVVGRVAGGEANAGRNRTSATGDLELSAGDVELSWHRLGSRKSR